MSLDHPRKDDGGQTHRIGRVRFDLSAAQEGDLMVLRAGIAKTVDYGLAAALGPALDAAARADQTIQIDRVVIDLGEMRAGSEIDLADLTRAATIALQRTLTGTDSDDDPGGGIEKQADPPIWNDIANTRVRAFAFYLRRGYLPTQVPDPALPALVAALFAMPLSLDVIHILVEALRRDRVAIERLLHVLDASQNKILFRAIAKEYDLDFDRIFSTFSKNPEIIAAQSRTSGQTDAVDLIHAILKGDAPNAPVTVAPQSAVLRDVAEPEKYESETLTATPIPDAGLVILGPFLPALFRGLSLDPRKEPVLSARLLHALAHGDSTTFYEPDMLIARILFGLPEHVALLDSCPLPPDHVFEAEHLLEAVIGHWTRLGNVSLAGLRETFLCRPGLLSTRKNAPLITVERRGVDVLIGGLPWALTPLRLPWLDQKIAVDWV